jgi:hypothetical protein
MSWSMTEKQKRSDKEWQPSKQHGKLRSTEFLDDWEAAWCGSQGFLLIPSNPNPRGAKKAQNSATKNSIYQLLVSNKINNAHTKPSAEVGCDSCLRFQVHEVCSPQKQGRQEGVLQADLHHIDTSLQAGIQAQTPWRAQTVRVFENIVSVHCVSRSIDFKIIFCRGS